MVKICFTHFLPKTSQSRFLFNHTETTKEKISINDIIPNHEPTKQT